MSGRICNSPCAPDESNEDFDSCDVVKGSITEKEFCVKIANINSVRLVIHEDRKKNLSLFPALIGEINQLMNQYSQVESY